MVFPLDVSLQLLGIEVHRPQIACGIPFRLIVEMLRPRIAAEATDGHGVRRDAGPKLDDGHKAVPCRPIHPLRARIRARAERRQRSPARRRERDRNAWRSVD